MGPKPQPGWSGGSSFFNDCFVFHHRPNRLGLFFLDILKEKSYRSNLHFFYFRTPHPAPWQIHSHGNMKSLLFIATTLLPQTLVEALCSCSPTEYTFRLDLSADCDTTTITQEQDGIDGSLCFFGEGSQSGNSIFPGEMVQGGQGGIGPVRKLKHSSLHNLKNDRSLQGLDLATSMRAPASPITEVTSILFLEVDTKPELNIINQDGTYFTTALSDGSVITYASISKQLDHTLPLKDQMEYVPGGVVLVLFGNDEEGNAVQNTVAWDYGGIGYCGSEPLRYGDAIGWIKIVSYT